jgi:aldehyde dehydrogenase (NAD+)
MADARAITAEAATFPSRIDGSIRSTDIPGKESRIYRHPVGVVGMISPWNFPFHLSSRSIAPAMACGNTVVIKPASDTPITGGTLLAKIYEEAGVPAGVINVVVGQGSAIGDAFIRHPVPRVLSFTGSTAVGKHIAELAAKGEILKKVTLELGGNSPCVILDDADVEQAVNIAVFGKFCHQGQICMAINRLIVDERVHDEFVNRFVERVRGLKVGNPADEDTVVGPLINQSQVDALMNRIEKGRAGGRRADHRRRPAGAGRAAARVRQRAQRHDHRARGAVRAGSRASSRFAATPRPCASPTTPSTVCRPPSSRATWNAATRSPSASAPA